MTRFMILSHVMVTSFFENNEVALILALCRSGKSECLQSENINMATSTRKLFHLCVCVCAHLFVGCHDYSARVIKRSFSSELYKLGTQ